MGLSLFNGKFEHCIAMGASQPTKVASAAGNVAYEAATGSIKKIEEFAGITQPPGSRGPNSSNGGDNGDGSDDGEVKGQCIEDNGYSLSEGSYIDEDRNAIVGSPCDPEEFCEDESSTDPIVRDFCADKWDDVDEDCPPGQGQVGTPPDCQPEQECPDGTTGTPPDCQPEQECPDGTTGTPPDCQPEEAEPVLGPESKEDDSDAAPVISVESSSRVLAVK